MQSAPTVPLTQDVDHAAHLVRGRLAASGLDDRRCNLVVGPAGRSPPGQKRVDLGVRRAGLAGEILGRGEDGGDLVGAVGGQRRQRTVDLGSVVAPSTARRG